MPRKVPALKPRELIRLLTQAGCRFWREGKGDHRLYVRIVEGKKRIVPIDMGADKLSPLYVLRILRQFSLTDSDIDRLFQ
jgi:predicted RNA binding protein YcfA (HicA-like mRNA interferase family)